MRLFLRRGLRQLHQSSNEGFLLPVVIALALAISTIGLAALQTVTNSSDTLNGQYYDTLANEAAQAGLAAANACIKASQTNVWTDANPLAPNTNCLGVANATGLNYVGKGDNWQSTYSVKAPIVTTSSITIISVGTTKILSNTGVTLRTITRSLKSTGTLSSGRVSKPVVDLSAGWAHVCAVAQARAYCWGWNASGQLGNGNTTNASSPVEVSQSLVSIPAQPALPSGCGGFFNPCTTPAVPAVPASAIAGKNVTNIASGTNHTCAIAEAIVYCWGKNNYGQLGNNSTTDSSIPVEVYMSPVSLPAQPALPSGCGGFFNPCTTPAVPAVPKGALVDEIPISISAGEDYTCVIAYPKTGTVNDSSAYCWGKNTNGQLGVNDETNRLTPTPVYTTSGSALYNKTVTQITAGTAHTCAITSDGVGSCWGLDTSGQVGSGQAPATSTGGDPPITCTDHDAGTIGTAPSSIPDIITPQYVYAASGSPLYNKKLLFINASGSYTNALADDGRVYWWGGQSPQATSPIKSNYLYCQKGAYSSPPCPSGQSSCWITTFENHYVTWTQYSYDIHDKPIGPIYQDHYTCWWFFTCQDNNLLTNKQLKMFSGSANLGTFCALDLNNTAYCDGTAVPYYGQLGDGVTPLSNNNNWGTWFQKSVPKLVDQTHALAGKTITKMVAGAYGDFTCVIASQAVYCWGINDVGEIGDGTTGTNNSKITPTATDISGPLGTGSGSNGVSNSITY